MGEYYHKIGLFEITPDKKESHIRHTFNDFNSFRVEFLKLTKQALDHGKRPDFEFGLTWYDYLAAQLQYVVSNIASYFAAEVFSAETLGNLLQDIYLLAYKFDFSHSDPFSNIIHKGQQGVLSSKFRIDKATKEKLKKTEPLRNNYLEICKKMKDENQLVTTTEINNKFREWIADNKIVWNFKNAHKGITKEESKQASITKTLARWRHDAGLDY